MAKPASVPSWATDANFSSGPESGSPTKVEPSSGAKAQGQVPGQPYRGPRMNWLFNLLCQWATYLNNLPTDNDFRNANFTWGGDHVFTNQVDAPGGVTSGGTIDAVNLVGVDVYSATGGEFTYGNGSPSPRARSVSLSLPASRVLASYPGDVEVASFLEIGGGGPAYLNIPANAAAVFAVTLPRDAVLTSWRAGIRNATGVTVNLSGGLMQAVADKVTPTAGFKVSCSTTGVGGVTSLASGAEGFMLHNALGTVTIDNSAGDYYLYITGDQSIDIFWVEVNYDDPGPRNG